jgi:adenylate kinase family enzyme
MRNIDVVFVAGAPGAGKTTVTEEYERRHSDAEQFGMGDHVTGIRNGTVDSKYAAPMQHAMKDGVYVPSSIFSSITEERILRARSDTATMMITGFPYSHEDWNAFLELVDKRGIRPIGSVVLDVDEQTSIERMKERDIRRGADPEAVSSHESYLVYRIRYQGLMGRHAIRLDCYRQAGLEVLSVFAQRLREEVFADFSDAMSKLRR